ncbi:hypothetical protein TB1_012424 [Malus domestica]
MSEFGSPTDGASPNSNSRFELAMLESSGHLLESYTKNSRLGDPRYCQALANIGSSSLMSVGDGVVCDAVPIFRSEFIADHLVQNLLDSEKQLEALRGEAAFAPMVATDAVFHWICAWATLPWFLGYLDWMGPVKACNGYAECACWSERERIVFVTRGTIKLSGRELADIEKVLRSLVSECQRRAMEKVGKKGETNAKKGKAPMLVPVDDILFHRGARKHRVSPTPKPKSQEEVLKIAALKKAEAEAIGCAATIVAREERRLLPPLPTINPIFPPTMEFTDQEGGPSCSRKRKYKEEIGSIHWKDLKVAMQPSSLGMSIIAWQDVDPLLMSLASR